MKMKILLSTAALTILAGVAFAGQTQPAPVEVNLDEGFATGDMVTARTEKGKEVFIGCGMRVYDDGVNSWTFGFCQAEDAEGDHIACFTENPTLLEAMRATGDYSFVTFSWNENAAGGFDGECIRIGFSTQSFYLPSNVEGNK
jgi:hypothetical protein